VAAAALPTGLIDTDILIDAERGVAQAVTFLIAQRAAGGLNLSVVSAMEMIEGCHNKQDLAALAQFLRYATIVQLNPIISQRAQSWMESFFLSHGLLSADALIAATAAELQLPLYTKNVRHFQMLPSLVVVRPY
jgi:predicted nucleic acid-binding protein